MAQKKPGSSSKTTVRRITADDSQPKKQTKTTTKKVATKAKKSSKVEASVSKKKVVKPEVKAKKDDSAKSMGYFKGAWHELKQVRWPTRANTWSMTLAVILFTTIFVVLILLLDAGFKWLFEQILK